MSKSEKDPVYLNQLGLLCCAGESPAELKSQLNTEKSFFTVSDAYGTDALPLGMHLGGLPEIPLKESFWQSRNNQFAMFAYEQIKAEVATAVERYAPERIGVVIGTSTSGIEDANPAFAAYINNEVLPDEYHYSIQEMGNTAAFIAELSGVTGPAYGISTACSSGVKAIITAKRLITSGLCDAVIAGGVDTLCKLTVQGFSALEAVSQDVCNPFSRNRNGINIGEAAALFVLSRKQEGVKLTGAGESSDAHHISAPHPEGKGAEQCMRAALDDACLKPHDIDYINLHGTATQLNDQMESRAVERVFTDRPLCSSTKPVTGHTLGAAGAIEAAIAWLTLTDNSGFIPLHKWDGEADDTIPTLNFVSVPTSKQQINCVLSNSFAFGGNNASIIMERIA